MAFRMRVSRSWGTWASSLRGRRGCSWSRRSTICARPEAAKAGCSVTISYRVRPADPGLVCGAVVLLVAGKPPGQQPPGQAGAQVRAAPGVGGRGRGFGRSPGVARPRPAQATDLVQHAVQGLALDELHGEVMD